MEFKELNWHERGRLWLRLLVRFLLTILFFVLIFEVGRPLATLCMPFVLAFIFTWILDPLVRLITERTKLSRSTVSVLLILLICGALGGVLVWLFYKVGVEVASLSGNWEAIWNEIMDKVQQLSDLFSRYLDYLPPAIRETTLDFSDRILEWAKNTGTALIPKTTSFAMGIPSIALATIISIMATYFITADYPSIRASVASWMPPNVREFSGFVKATFHAAFGGYLRAEIFLSIIVFFILFLGFSILRQPYALLIAFLLAVLDFIPIIGAGTIMVPWAVIDFALGEWKHGIALLAVWGVIVLFRRIAEPRAVGSQTGLHPALSLLSIYVGMRAFGVLGMVFGPVVLMVLINVFSCGIFSNVNADIILAFHDLSYFLKGDKKT